MALNTVDKYIEWQLDILNGSHTLIAGCSGSGKSVALRSVLTEAIRKSPLSVNLILIDLKRVELIDFKDAPHTLAYVDKPEEVTNCLDVVMDIIEQRFAKMKANREKVSSESDIYVVIDEFADLVLTTNKHVIDNIQRISQIGRAARVHLIICTQRPTKEVIKGAITVNLETRLALRTVCAQDSRNIIGVSGAEALPKYGFGIFQHNGYNNKISIDLVPDSEIERLIDYWNKAYPIIMEQKKLNSEHTVSVSVSENKTRKAKEEDLLPNAEEWKRVVNAIGKAFLR